MPKMICMPKIGVNMTDAIIAKWLVKVGDIVEPGQSILLAETDKATQEIPVTEAGKVVKLISNESDRVDCQQPILVLESEGESLTRSEIEQFNVCALRLAHNGIKTALIEKNSLGGTCLNWGCIPTKSLVQNAAVIDTLKKGDTFGFAFDNLSVDYNAAYARSRKVVQRLRSGIEYLVKKNQIDLFVDNATLLNKNEVQTVQNGKVYGENIVLATGSSAKVPARFICDDKRVLTARTALEIQQLPKHMVIVGAGAIGVEFAYIWSRYGCKITIIEMMDEVLPNYDHQVCKSALKALRESGIQVLLGSKVEQVELAEQNVILEISGMTGTQHVKCDTVLVATGVSPNIGAIGLEDVGIKTHNGAITVDSNMRTNIPNIYAVGDVTGKLALAHAASAQGILAADVISGKVAEEICYDYIPKCVYCVPEIASVGLTEQQCIERERKVNIGFSPFSANGKAIAIHDSEGFIKVIADAETDEILGVHMVGPHVTELIAQCNPLMKLQITSTELFDTVFPHPSLSEAFWEAANDSIGNMIHK